MLVILLTSESLILKEALFSLVIVSDYAIMHIIRLMLATFTSAQPWSKFI